MKDKTKLINAGRVKRYTGAAVNPRLVRASTIVFDTVEQMNEAAKQCNNSVEYYGRRGTATTFALTQAIAELENAEGCYVYSCGTAAITSSLLAFLSHGDHVLMVDSVYEPTREFADGTLTRLGIEVSYYDPLIGARIESLIRANTKVIFLESPGSWTMEVQDVPAIAKVAKQHDVVTIIDNTYATPINFRPLDVGVDVSIHSATKYLCGHSDVMLGVASANAASWPTLQKYSYQLGHCAAVDDCYSALRGLRTLSLRMSQHNDSAVYLASWLQKQNLVHSVRHPGFDDCPGSEYFHRDFSGGNGLFSVLLKSGNQQALDAMLNSFEHFKMGFSWGGFESLALGSMTMSNRRTVTDWQDTEPILRLHIGLEDVEDLKADLAQALAVYANYL
ncbi:MAG: cystathionine beta-lyase [Gammaproteobacteria bacterium]|nr:cystathionine beta-lyase [Gammaproteobacteria bacterium]